MADNNLLLAKSVSFLKDGEIVAALSTPLYLQSNGHAKTAVKAVKSLVTKNAQSGSGDIEVLPRSSRVAEQ